MIDRKEFAMRAMLLVGLVGFCGCETESVGVAEVTIPDLVTVVGTTGKCDLTRCGTNSSVIDEIGFHELNLKGLANTQGLRLVGFVKGQVGYTPHVVSGRLSGTNSTETIEHAGLIGAQLIVVDPSGTESAITIQGVGTMTSCALLPGVSPDKAPILETYSLQWGLLGKADGQPLCAGQAGQDTLGMIAGTAVLFEGDRIDAKSKTVSSTIDTTWFNIGCAGSALAKLALTGHTEAAKANGYVTTTKERQTMLKMLVADYCGDGTAFTVPGEPLCWQDDQGWMRISTTVRVPVEARWTSAGAACLGALRLDVNPPASWPPEFPQPILPAVIKICPWLPPCTDSSPYNQDGFHLISANPFL